MTNTSQFDIGTHPIGWRCRLCGQVLELPIMDRASAEADPDIQAAFRAHDCARYREEIARKSRAASAGPASRTPR